MPLIQKRGPAQAVNLAGDINNPPTIPQTLKDRYPEMEQWDASHVRWWVEFKTKYQRDSAQIQSTLTALQAAITALDVRVTKLGG